jgi:hypothetical protein
LNLLTTELFRGIFCQHPTESESRASGLQIWLIIEAYQVVQRCLRQQYSNNYARSIGAVLDHWLQALHWLYDLSHLEKVDMSQADQDDIYSAQGHADQSEAS